MLKRKPGIKNLLIFFLASVPLLIIHCGTEDENLAGNIIAKIGEETITIKNLDMVIESIPTPYRYEYKSEQALHDLVHSMIDWKLMAKEAIKTGLDQEANVKAQLEKMGDRSKIKSEQLLFNAYTKKRQSQLEKITDAEIKDYYHKHQEEFKIPERVRVERIFFKAREEAKAALEEMKKGMSFEELMEQNPNFRRKINSLWLHRRGGKSEMERIAFNLQKEEVSNIFETKKGYCLLRVEEKVPSTLKTLEETKGGIRAKLNNQKRKDLVDQIKKDLRKKTKITINQPLLKAYQLKENHPKD